MIHVKLAMWHILIVSISRDAPPQGARVVIADLQGSKGEEVAKEIGANATFAPTDVSSRPTGN